MGVSVQLMDGRVRVLRPFQQYFSYIRTMEGRLLKALCNETPFRFGTNIVFSRIRTRDLMIRSRERQPLGHTDEMLHRQPLWTVPAPSTANVITPVNIQNHIFSPVNWVMFTVQLKEKHEKLRRINYAINIESHYEKTCLMPFANNESADQPAHLCSRSAPLLFTA